MWMANLTSCMYAHGAELLQLLTNDWTSNEFPLLNSNYIIGWNILFGLYG